MAKIWWSTDPSRYYSKNTRKGGRNAIVATLIGKI